MKLNTFGWGKKLKETFSALSQTSFSLVLELLQHLSLDYCTRQIRVVVSR